ncbi:type 2 isopentenyl-diphosphate Delta-isomerase [Lonsdalea iberica]|uniref:Isopentenyl-diphosphate delta-isomerase n=1 Tax=Lonsdalea iberica TaxID=1082703 RepID=A0A1X3RYT4_9GAMM|nr:type 2 isopentenyl-diphosphate Delta-isomerase [Lonsdalea iberica]OSN07309.1 type 2 isopentenyl-diphosphate Delta-isomerase [Lonsdalea iberica]
MKPSDALSQRKNDHLDIVLRQKAASHTSAGWDLVQFEHCALPELSLEGIDLSSTLLGIGVRAPLLISSMTGGARRAEAINRHLAEAAQSLRIAMGVGSQRVSLRTDHRQGLTRALRRAAPNVPLLANIGAAQLLESDGLTLASRAVETLEANGLIIHLNPLQEAVQPEGDRDWRGVLACIARTTAHLGVPVMVKEVGTGLSARVARMLVDAGVQAIDIAGMGGTHWAAVEAERADHPADREVAMAFADWGIPSVTAVQQVRQALPETTLVASGGIRNGVDAAKALRLGADIVGQAAGVLEAATRSTEAVIAHFDILIRQLKIACFCTGSGNLAALRQARLLPPPGMIPEEHPAKAPD